MYEAIQGRLYAAGLVNLDAESMGIQVVVFLLFMAMLNHLVVQPMIRTHRARFDRMMGARQEAEKMDLRAAEAHARYEAQILTARQDAVGARDDLTATAETTARQVLDQASEETQRALAAGRGVLAEDVGEARGQVDASVDELAELIAERMLAGGAS